MQNDISTIRTLNDAFRTTFVGGKVMLANSVASSPVELRQQIIAKVRDYDDFKSTDELDEYERDDEHDMGFFEINSVSYLFKIDCYDATMEYGSENPADASITTRVLTIMESRDY